MHMGHPLPDCKGVARNGQVARAIKAMGNCAGSGIAARGRQAQRAG